MPSPLIPTWLTRDLFLDTLQASRTDLAGGRSGGIATMLHLWRATCQVACFTLTIALTIALTGERGKILDLADTQARGTTSCRFMDLNYLPFRSWLIVPLPKLFSLPRHPSPLPCLLLSNRALDKVVGTPFCSIMVTLDGCSSATGDSSIFTGSVFILTAATEEWSLLCLPGSFLRISTSLLLFFLVAPMVFFDSFWMHGRVATSCLHAKISISTQRFLCTYLPADAY